jgi:xylan 1,4-beta-xylosidase
LLISKEKSDIPYNGNFQIVDSFNMGKLNPNWVFLRTPHEKWFDLNQRKGFLSMRLRPETCADSVNPSFIGHRQQHAQSSASTAIHFDPQYENEKAGLLVFQNENHFYYLCKSLEGNSPLIQLYKSGDSQMGLISSQKLEDSQSEKKLLLKIEVHGNVYSFSYGFEPDNWYLLKNKVDAIFLSTKEVGGFVGCMYALYATSLDISSDNIAYYDWFEYRGDDEVYKKIPRH